MSTIQIAGIAYNVISSQEIAGKPGRREFKLQRPNGRRFYFVVQYENGTMSEVV